MNNFHPESFSHILSAQCLLAMSTGLDIAFKSISGENIVVPLFDMSAAYSEYRPTAGKSPVSVRTTQVSYDPSWGDQAGMDSQSPFLNSVHPICYDGVTHGYPTFANIVFMGSQSFGNTVLGPRLLRAMGIGSSGRAVLVNYYNNSMQAFPDPLTPPSGSLDWVQVKGAYSATLGLNTLSFVFSSPSESVGH